jgi:hypothetical protein
MEKRNFIKVKDEETKEQLLNLGYKLLSEKNGIATFLNDLSRPQSFSCKKVTYTNKMEI